MDTHITHLDPETPAGQSARLPDEPDLAHFATSGEDFGPLRDNGQDTAALLRARPSKRRGRLLAGIAIGTIGLCAASAFLVSPWNTTVPVPSLLRDAARSANHAFASLSVAGHKPSTTATASSRHDRDPVLAPAASVASIKLKERPATITKSAYVPSSPHQDLDQVLALGASKPTSPAAAAAAQDRSNQATSTASAASSRTIPAAVTDIHEPGNTAPPSSTAPETLARPDITAAVTEAALHPTPPPSEMPTPPVSAPPAAHSKGAVSTADSSGPSLIEPGPATGFAKTATIPPPVPIAAAASAQPGGTTVTAPLHVAAVTPLPATVERVTHPVAAPIIGHEQTEVLQAVTQLAKMVANLKVENASLRKDVSSRMTEQEGRLADFDRRVSLAEARSALQEAADAGKPEMTTPSETKPVVTLASTAPTRKVASPVSPSVAATTATRTRYRVQAASPGLALLAEVARGGGDGAQIQVVVGDKVPGWGVVKSVSQNGANWVVLTENGAID